MLSTNSKFCKEYGVSKAFLRWYNHLINLTEACLWVTLILWTNSIFTGIVSSFFLLIVWLFFYIINIMGGKTLSSH